MKPDLDQGRAGYLTVRVAPASRRDTDPTLTIGPVTAAATDARADDSSEPSADDPRANVVIDGTPATARLAWLDPWHADLLLDDDGIQPRARVTLGPVRRRGLDGIQVREVVIGGWRFEVEFVAERRDLLRERARRASASVAQGGPIEVRAIIPGRIVAVSVATGDRVSAGQQILVLEAMKMQNELRAPRDGQIERVAASVGENVEVGDLLMVIS